LLCETLRGFVAMPHASLVAIASMCLTAHSTRTPGGGCCVNTLNGFSLTQMYPVQLDEVDAKIPEGAECDPEISGTEAISSDGKMVQDMSANCYLSSGVTTYRSVDLNLPNGTSLNAVFVYHPNGTVEADCGLTTRLGQSSQDAWCYGPDYHADQKFDGTVTYGSLVAERYALHSLTPQPQAFMDVDVENGCIPIRMPGFTITNYVNSDPAESLFAIPQECFQQGAKAVGPVKQIKSILPSLKTMRSSSVV